MEYLIEIAAVELVDRVVDEGLLHTHPFATYRITARISIQPFKFENSAVAMSLPDT